MPISHQRRHTPGRRSSILLPPWNHLRSAVPSHQHHTQPAMARILPSAHLSDHRRYRGAYTTGSLFSLSGDGGHFSSADGRRTHILLWVFYRSFSGVTNPRGVHDPITTLHQNGLEASPKNTSFLHEASRPFQTLPKSL